MTDFHISKAPARKEALAILKKGGVVVLPTDTFYGLSTAASSTVGIERIRGIKHSSDERLFIVLASSIEMVEAHVRSFGCSSRDELERVWPAPVTAILPLGSSRADWMGDTVAVRVPAVAPLLELIDALGEPVVSTSVNRVGEAPRTSLAEIEAEFGGEVDMMVSGDDADKRKAAAHASTIVDLTGDEPVVVRKGDYEWPVRR